MHVVCSCVLIMQMGKHFSPLFPVEHRIVLTLPESQDSNNTTALFNFGQQQQQQQHNMGPSYRTKRHQTQQLETPESCTASYLLEMTFDHALEGKQHLILCGQQDHAYPRVLVSDGNWMRLVFTLRMEGENRLEKLSAEEAKTIGLPWRIKYKSGKSN